ncbi:MAG TPA: universal stress protein [Solirubrobacteraceae bacterium]|nr:universal stress protein [Solirubrobacteraceae bacterium]
MFEHVAVGCDGGREGRDAAVLGAALAAASSARLTLIGVVCPPLFPVAGVSDRNTLRAATTRALRHDRDLLACDARIDAITGTSVPRALHRWAARAQADLVVVGSSASARPGRVAIGRRGRQLFHHAPFALAVAARGLHEQDGELRTIGVGYDGAPESEAALTVAGELAAAERARLVVRRVVEDTSGPFGLEGSPLLQGWSEMLEQERQVSLTEAQNAAARLDVIPEVSVTIGDPGYELRAFSDAVDLLVVGSRRWGAVARLVSGAVGETLVADAGCSIVIVPRPSRVRRARTGQRRQRSTPLT